MIVWNKKRKIVTTVAVMVFIVVLVAAGIKIQKKMWEKEKKEYLAEQERLKQELEPFMEEARAVMRGEKTATGELAYYNFYQEGYEDVTSIDADANIIVAEIHGDKGALVVEYHIEYLDKNEKRVSGGGSLGHVWKIEKAEDGSWVLVDIPHAEGGEESVKEAEKLMKKLRKYEGTND